MEKRPLQLVLRPSNQGRDRERLLSEMIHEVIRAALSHDERDKKP
ncbi:hypothetical protein [Paenibacillus sp. KN14-4R]